MVGWPCKRCGACCCQGYVAVTALEAQRLPAHLTAGDRMVTSEAGRCIALEGDLGEPTRCQVYEDRPAPCREFQSGTGTCRRVRRDK